MSSNEQNCKRLSVRSEVELYSFLKTFIVDQAFLIMAFLKLKVFGFQVVQSVVNRRKNKQITTECDLCCNRNMYKMQWLVAQWRKLLPLLRVRKTLLSR